MGINWGNIAGAGVEAGIEMLGGAGQANRQYHKSKKLMGLQHQNQRDLNQQGHDLQFDMWNKTNYGAQVKHMLEAGLNPALMYGSAGQGGTTGSQGGGSAAGGSPVAERMMDLDVMMKAKQIEQMEEGIEYSKWQRGERGTADINEINARIRNLDKDTIKKIQETTNLKTLDEWNKVKKGLDQLKESKKVTGSAIVDLMTAVGLDPVNNEADANAVRTLIGIWYGTKVAKDAMQGIGAMKGKNTNIGEVFNNINNHKN